MKVIFSLILVLGSIFLPSKTFSHFDLVICAVFQNEEIFLKEWIEHHQSIGVQHFYLYNNLSTDSSLEIIEPYIARGDIDLFEWPVDTSSQEEYLSLLQIPAYQHALNIVKENTTWAAFIDIDEFIVPLQHKNLLELMDDYKDFAGLVINWQVFGTSGYKKVDSIRKNLLFKGEVDLEMNQIVKLIVQPRFIEKITDPHFFQFKDGFFPVNSRKEKLDATSRVYPVHIDTVQINHYWFGPEDWFINNKLVRRAKWGIFIPTEYVNDLIDSFNVIKDESILKFTVP